MNTKVSGTITINELAGMVQRGFAEAKKDMDERFSGLEQRMDLRFEDLEHRIDLRFDDVQGQLDGLRASHAAVSPK